MRERAILYSIHQGMMWTSFCWLWRRYHHPFHLSSTEVPFPTWSLADGILAAQKSPNPADRWFPLVGHNSLWVGDFNELCITCFICLCWCKYICVYAMQCILYHMYVKIHLRKYDIPFQRCVTFVYVCKFSMWVHNPRSWSPVPTFIQMHMHIFKITVYTLKSYVCINWNNSSLNTERSKSNYRIIGIRIRSRTGSVETTHWPM